ncbi:MAG TPA: hypothetical protein VKV20_03595 [Ktedonobacteraceae bacterium]|nr:hypothetical protein [Ktedonobacteraceae bacterium]
MFSAEVPYTQSKNAQWGQVADDTATIDWGDGTTTTATVSKNPHGKGFVLIGLHRYARKGTYSVILTVGDSGGSQATLTVIMTIK